MRYDIFGRAWLVLLALVASQPAWALDHVVFGTDWRAEAEHGGYYEAIAQGIYARHGIEVDLRQGGPQINQTQLLAAGRLDFAIVSNSFLPLNAVQQKIPLVAVGALFQKDPTVLIAHRGAGYKDLASLKGKPIMIGGDTRVGWWLFLKAKFGYTDAQIRPYTFNLAPFLTNSEAIQQGYLTSEPFLIRQAGGDPRVFLLADAGYASYGSLIETSAKLIHDNPDLVKRFVDASIEGWYAYLYGDPAPANALIKRGNPEQTHALLAYARATMISHGIVDSGDSKKLGIGAMTDARWHAFFTVMSKQGLYPASLDYRQAYTPRFVDRGVGLKAQR
ncbi:MAG: ABC transporter substrate-binding protein [Alphaproteobacteria bacterium]|nr:ABC transporter substrate-binding protein [Alphaproteobacteria bacterium]